jgi:PAS domain S-box-containing protein
MNLSQFRSPSFTPQDKEEFFNLSGILYSITDGGNYFKKASPSWARLLEYSTEELIRTPLYNLIHSEDLSKTMSEFLSLSARSRSFENTSQFTARFLTKTGKTLFIHWSSKVLTNGQILSISQDISDLVQRNEIKGNLKGQDQLIEEFTETELKIFTLLSRNVGDCVTKENLYKNIYGDVQVQDQTINVHISNLRKKLQGSAFTLKTAGKGRWKLLNKYQTIA